MNLHCFQAHKLRAVSTKQSKMEALAGAEGILEACPCEYIQSVFVRRLVNSLP